MRKLEKEHSELEGRLTALKQGTAFLNNLKALSRRYLQQRSAHAEEPETVRNYFYFKLFKEILIAKRLQT